MRRKPFDPLEFAASFEASVARSNADHARAARLAALKAAVVEAAMVYWRAKLDLTYSCLDLRAMEDAEDAACAALEKAEKE